MRRFLYGNVLSRNEIYIQMSRSRNQIYKMHYYYDGQKKRASNAKKKGQNVTIASHLFLQLSQIPFTQKNILSTCLRSPFLCKKTGNLCPRNLLLQFHLDLQKLSQTWGADVIFDFLHLILWQQLLPEYYFSVVHLLMCLSIERIY